MTNKGAEILKGMEDAVSHPAHYARGCSLECIDVMMVAFGPSEVLHYCLCNAFKYLWRYQNKNGLEDVLKAEWYLDYSEGVIAAGFGVSDSDVYTHQRLKALCDKEHQKVLDARAEGLDGTRAI